MTMFSRRGGLDDLDDMFSIPGCGSSRKSFAYFTDDVVGLIF